MTLIPIDIPAGVYKNGTDLEGQGRWQDTSLVRWRDNTLRPVGGWASRKTNFSTNAIRGFHAWEANNGSRYYAGGSYSEFKAATSNNTVYDITPIEFVDGDEHSVLETGYGYGVYGSDTYGTERLASGTYSEANSWQVDNFGEYLIGCSYADGKLYEWQLGVPDTTHITALTPYKNSSTWSFVADGDGYNFYYYTTSPSANRYILTQLTDVTPRTHYRVSWTFYDDPATTGQQIEARLSIVYSDGTATEAVYDATYTQGQTKSDDIYVGDNVSRIDLRFESVSTSDDVSIFDVKIEGYEGLAFPMPNAPTNNLGLVATEERTIFALGAGGNPRKVQWCDIEDNATWAASAANQAGDIELQTSGQIMQGIRTRGQVLILTDIDAHSARYSGPPFVYGFQRVGTACGAVSRMAAVDTDAGVFWMGQRGFYRFDGNVVQELTCDVFDHVFGELQDRNKSKTWAWNNSEYGEVWWFYQSEAQSDTGEVDKYVAYDFKENHWHIGSLSRTAGVSRGVFRHPLLLEANDVYNHEIAGTGATNMFAETGPIQLGNGDNIAHITQLIPDEKTQGDVQVKFKSKFYPNDTEYEHGPYDPTNPTGVRFAGRQFKLRIEPDDGADFRVGIMRVDAQQGGKR